MSTNDNTARAKAATLVDENGHKAQQIVVDEIVRAIKASDIKAAKRWDVIGREVDRLLAA